VIFKGAMKRIRYYISGHGLGHASRSCQIINTLRSLRPDIEVEVVSDAHRWFFHSFLDPSVPVRRRRLDIGVLQKDSLLMLEKETLVEFRRFLKGREKFIVEESESLKRDGIGLVAADIPPFAFAAAEKAEIPSVGISNFTWDWIYEGLAAKYPGYGDVPQAVASDYRRAERLLRLPFHGPCDAFQAIEDLSLVARRSSRDPVEVRRLLGSGMDRKLGLLSFGGFGLQGIRLDAVEKLTDWIFLAPAEMACGASNLKPIPPEIPYPDLVGAADVVLTKPGYGIVSECIANRTAVLYTRRGDFREQELLIEGIRRYTRGREIENDSLRNGNWGPDLEALLSSPAPAESLPAHGDRQAAGRLAELLEKSAG